VSGAPVFVDKVIDWKERVNFYSIFGGVKGDLGRQSGMNRHDIYIGLKGITSLSEVWLWY
jgi:hypothetical protein